MGQQSTIDNRQSTKVGGWRSKVEGRRSQGFTLIEIVVASAVFSLFLLGAVGAVSALTRSGSYASQVRGIQSSAELSVDALTRLIRNDWGQIPAGTVPTVSGSCVAGAIPAEWAGDLNVTVGSTLAIGPYTVSGGAGRIQVSSSGAQAGSYMLPGMDQVAVEELCFEVSTNPKSFVRFAFRLAQPEGTPADLQIDQGQGVRLQSMVVPR